ncbi:alpha/beta hydrolase [Asticcacaulis sp. EMRT-3]|uniref:alpha/beta hydrolase n=1 Tax=Asticcacaulis sp. EMRT-3 TaxID=3040349 RepID=UPI0024AED340|nr:alpha/beta hydrolase [Asticcacaulis sp. EMRT-3]MDI7774015.1 alpha/beta hydrolase [Asticcacaulis sp. EMRT-3]
MRISAINPAFLKSFLLKVVLSLPAPLLRAASGGRVVHVDGQTLDPQMQFLWQTWLTDQRGQPRLGVAGRPLDQAHQDWHEIAAFLSPPPSLRVRFETTGSSGLNTGLLIRPARIADDMPLLVFFAQGGHVLGGPELSRAFCALLAHEAGCPVFLPALRLAPDHRFPAALEDARAAIDWAQANAYSLGSVSGRIAVGGALTGAGLAARLCFELKRAFKPMPVAQLLFTPLLDFADPALRGDAPSAGVWPLTSADLVEMIGHYTGGGSDLSDPLLSPLRESLIVGQPKTLIVSAGLDPLAPQAEAYARRLLAARSPVIYRRYDTLPLGFDLFVTQVDAARAAVIDIAALWRDLLRDDTDKSA